jgi:hypothetical protein
LTVKLSSGHFDGSTGAAAVDFVDLRGRVVWACACDAAHASRIKHSVTITCGYPLLRAVLKPWPVEDRFLPVTARTSRKTGIRLRTIPVL